MYSRDEVISYYFIDHAFSNTAKYAHLYVTCDTPLHNHSDFCEFSLVTYGSFTNQYKGKSTVLPKNSLIFFQKGECHSITKNEQDSIHFSIIFQKQYFEYLMTTHFPNIPSYNLGKYMEQHLTNTQAEYLNDLANRLMNNTDINTREKLAHLFFFTAMTFCMIPIQENIHQNSSSIYIDNLINNLNSFAYLKKSIKDIYKDYPISKSTLIALFKQRTGYTIVQYQNKKKMEYATQLLNLGEHDITEISTMLNFTSLSYFIRLFKAHYGVSPNEYKRSHKRQYVSEEDYY